MDITAISLITRPNNSAFSNSTAPEWTDLDKRVRALRIVAAPTIFIFGVTGNTLILIVMLLGPSFRKSNAAIYFAALAVADTMCLCVQRLTRDWLEIVCHVLLDVLSEAGCRILMFSHYVSSCSGSWLIVAVTSERLFVVCFPLKAKVICSRRKAGTIVLLVLFAAMLANSYALFLFRRVKDPVDGYWYCVQGEEHEAITAVVDFSLYSFVPSIAIWTTNIVLIRKLRSQDEFRRVSTHTNKLTGSVTRGDSGTGTIANAPRMSIMLITLSFTFFFLTTPISVWFVTYAVFPNAIPTYPGEALTAIRELLTILSSMNPAINIVLYSLTGPRFRQDLKAIFSRLWKCCSPKVKEKEDARENRMLCCCKTGQQPIAKRALSSKQQIYQIDCNPDRYTCPDSAIMPNGDVDACVITSAVFHSGLGGRRVMKQS